MDEKIYQIAEQIVQLHQKAYEVYLPLVEAVCRRYLYVYPRCIKFYIEVYQEMWGDENE